MLNTIKKSTVRIQHIIKNTVQTTQLFFDNQIHLKNGDYKFTYKTKPIIYKPNYLSKKFINKLKVNGQKSKVTSFFKYPFFIKLKVNNLKESSSQGDLLMGVRNKDFKIFNFEKKTVVNFINNRKRYEKLIENYEMFDQYFKTPFISKDVNRMIIIEKYIDFKPYYEWSNLEKKHSVDLIFQGIHSSINSQLSEYISFITSKDIITNIKETKVDSMLIKKIEALVPESFSSIKWPVIQSHGDMNYSNILLDKDSFYFIDWEDSSINIFYYDFMNYILTSALRGDYSYLDSYNLGEYDNQLKQIFNAASIEFIPSQKKYYLLLYILERTKNLNEADDNYNINDLLINDLALWHQSQVRK